MSALTPLNSTLSTSVNNVQSQIKDVQTQLATGTKTLDAGQLGTVTRLSSQVTGYNAATANITQAQSVISVAQTGLSSINDLVTQMIDLANKASNASVSTTDRAKLDATFQSLLTQVDSIAANTQLNGVNIIGTSAANAAAYNASLANAVTVATSAATATSAAVNTATTGTAAVLAAAIATDALGSTAGTQLAVANAQVADTNARAADAVAQAAKTAAIAAAAAPISLTGTSVGASATIQTGITAADTMTIHGVDSSTAGLGIKGLSLSGQNASNAALTTLKAALDTLSTNQSSLSADNAGFAAKGKTDAAIATQLQASIDTIAKPDQAKLQMDLQSLNNQQSVDYYLISQLNTESSAAMTIFR